MIKISNCCLVDKSVEKLDEIAKFHLGKINPLKKNGTPYVNSLASRLKSAKDKFSSHDYLVSFCNGDISHQDRLKAFVDYFLSDNMAGLNRVVLSNPQDFNSIVNDINRIVIPSDWTTTDGSKSDFYNTISNDIFTYTNYRKSQGCIDTYKKLLGNQAQCFYCNNCKMDIVCYENGKEKLLLDLDHFYLKSKYPYFSLSFFNLIPCCSSCNSSVRGDIDFNTEYHINPYGHCFNSEFVFRLSSEEIVKLALGADNPFTLVNIIPSIGSTRINDRTVEDLHLIERYRNEIPTINNLAMKYRRQKHLKNIDFQSFVEMIYGYQYSEIPLEPEFISRIQMAKLKRDILAQLSGEE
ncbi:hypothetical protein [Photobacterium leiognathi]|uniref:hypothetical protein n=1 Tax=Photobacterium leiognathi TaxID=553611 RepID=UPI002981DE0F|nr:hypothetical protein [Photobacterium leiognathi]